MLYLLELEAFPGRSQEEFCQIWIRITGQMKTIVYIYWLAFVLLKVIRDSPPGEGTC